MSDELEQEQPENQEESSLRDDMEAAMSEVAEREGVNEVEENVEETPEVEAEKTQSPTDGNPSPATTSEAGTEDKPEAGAGEVKAPQSWSPT